MCNKVGVGCLVWEAVAPRSLCWGKQPGSGCSQPKSRKLHRGGVVLGQQGRLRFGEPWLDAFAPVNEWQGSRRKNKEAANSGLPMGWKNQSRRAVFELFCPSPSAVPLSPRPGLLLGGPRCVSGSWVGVGEMPG